MVGPKALRGSGGGSRLPGGVGGLFARTLRGFLHGALKNTSVFTIFGSGDIKTLVFYVVFCMWASKALAWGFQTIVFNVVSCIGA